MKKFKYIFLLIGLSIIGCSDLEEEPVGRLAPESYFTSIGKLETAVNAPFGYMHNRFFLARETGLTLMLRSDMIEISDPNTTLDRRDHNALTDAANNDQTLQGWKIMYQIIAAANEAIAGAELVEADASVKNAIIAKAYFARAFTYFHLVQQFGAIPYFDAPVTNVQEASNVGKTSVEDVYKNIIADLKFAKEWLPLTQPNKSIPAKSAASAFLASAYLTMGDYPNAYAEAKDFIGKKGTYNIDLEPDFQNLFNAAKVSKEPIFILDFIGNSSLGNYSTDYLVPLTGIRKDNQFGIGQEGWAVMVPALKVYQSFNDLDYRKAVSFNTTAKFGTSGAVTPYTGFFAGDNRNKNQPYIAKYTRFRGATPGAEGRASSTNYSMIRYAEVLLIAAEALNEVTPGTTEADGYVNEVRKRARDGAVGSVASLVPANVTGGMSKDAFRTMVLEERRLELAFEQKRWYDIVRRKMAGAPYNVFGTNGLEGSKNFTDANYLLAIPAEEVARNPKLGL